MMNNPIKAELADLGPYNGMGEPDATGSYHAFRLIDKGDPGDEHQELTFMVPAHQLPTATAPDRLSGRVTVKALEWQGGGWRYHAGDYVIEDISESREKWRLLRASFGTKYLADYGGDGALEAAKAAAQADFESRILAALDTAPAPIGEPVTLTYTNYRGETAERVIEPKGVWFGKTDWHPEPQWFLRAIDCQKGEMRDFALRDFGVSPDQIRREALREALDITYQEIDKLQMGPAVVALEKAAARIEALITGGDDDNRNP